MESTGSNRYRNGNNFRHEISRWSCCRNENQLLLEAQGQGAECFSPRAPGSCTFPLELLCTSVVVSSIALWELAVNFHAFIYNNKLQNFRYLWEKLRNTKWNTLNLKPQRSMIIFTRLMWMFKLDTTLLTSITDLHLNDNVFKKRHSPLFLLFTDCCLCYPKFQRRHSSGVGSFYFLNITPMSKAPPSAGYASS